MGRPKKQGRDLGGGFREGEQVATPSGRLAEARGYSDGYVSLRYRDTPARGERAEVELSARLVRRLER